jgi:hypothetical protein
MALTLQNLRLGGNLEFPWYSCNILRYFSNRCIVWFFIPASCPVQTNRKIPVQLYVKIQIIFEPPFWICKWANHLSFLAMFWLPLWYLQTFNDATNLNNILYHKSDKSNIPHYSKDHPVPIILYTYTTHIVIKIFSYKYVMWDLSIDDLKSKPPDSSCASSPFTYHPNDHVVTESLKYHEPIFLNWRHSFTILMGSVEDYARHQTMGKTWKRGLRCSFQMG